MKPTEPNLSRDWVTTKRLVGQLFLQYAYQTGLALRIGLAEIEENKRVGGRSPIWKHEQMAASQRLGKMAVKLQCAVVAVGVASANLAAELADYNRRFGEESGDVVR